MKIDSIQQDWVKMHQGMIKKFLNDRMQDCFNQVVDEPDPQRKEVLSLLVKEFRKAISWVDQITSAKEDKKIDADFTGV